MTRASSRACTARAARPCHHGARQDVVEDTVHFAEREAHLFDQSADALIMFTSGTTGKSKAVKLTWANLVGSARSANRSAAGRGRGALAGGAAFLPHRRLSGSREGRAGARSLCACTSASTPSACCTTPKCAARRTSRWSTRCCRTCSR